MSHDHKTPEEQLLALCAQGDRLEQEMTELRNVAIRNFAAGEIERFGFNANKLKWLDDHGSNCLAYAVYNPNPFKVFVGLAGASADADGLVIPKQKLVVAPIEVNGHIELGVAAGEVGGGGTVIRVRFPTPQPFFVGALE